MRARPRLLQRDDGPGPASGGASKLVRGLPSYPVGMVLVARLAVESMSHGRGLGSRLLAEVLRKTAAAGEAAAARLVGVDAIDQSAARFPCRATALSPPESAP